jgi:hypothetical protein
MIFTCDDKYRSQNIGLSSIFTIYIFLGITVVVVQSSLLLSQLLPRFLNITIYI